MFKKIKMRLTWTNAISYFLFMVVFLAIFYFSFVQILEKIQENMVESYAASNMETFFNVFDRPMPPPNRFDVEADQVSFYYVISDDLEILYGKELHDGFHSVLEKQLEPIQGKQFTRYNYNGDELLVMVQDVRSHGQLVGYIAVGQDVTQYKTLLNNVVVLLIVLLVVSSVGIGALSYFLAKKSMAPIQTSYEQQRQFVANASHELRTPLAVLNSSLELFEQQLQQEQLAYSKETMSDMKYEATYMKEMLNSLLMLTRSDQNQLQLNKTSEDLSSLVLQRVRRFAKTIHHVTFQLDVADECIATVDKILIEELLYILLKNAVNYTEQGTVKIRVYEQQGCAKLEICDSGIGISEEHLPHIFERFYRADPSRTSAGTGLGLSIAQIIVSLHNGRIDVSSVFGEGTTFIVSLPFK